jgi:hypothetical protein
MSPLAAGDWVMYDDFNRSDTLSGSLGYAESGQKWDLRGPYSGGVLPPTTYGQIKNGEFVADPASVAVYAVQQLTNTPTLIGGTVSWTQSSGSVGSSFAMVMSKNNVYVTNMLHFSIGRSGWTLSVSGPGIGSFVTVASGNISPVIPADGSPHTFQLSINGSAATIDIDGSVFAVYDNGNATYYSGSIFQSSDQRLKTNVLPLEASSSLSLIALLNPVSYARLDQTAQGTNLGFIAQQVSFRNWSPPPRRPRSRRTAP